MPNYEYRNDETGRTFEDFYKPGEAPEERFVDGLRFRRVYGCLGVAVHGSRDAVSHGHRKLPTSVSLPRVSADEMRQGNPIGAGGYIELRDGRRCDMVGRPIIENSKDAALSAVASGMQRLKD